MILKKVAAIHDISGYGRCSLSVILPLISAMGAQVIPVPTAVLSGHTAIEGFAMRDLSEFPMEALQHYQAIGLIPDAVYSGFLANAQQIAACLAFLNACPTGLKVVDPVLGDEGQCYRTITPALVNEMRRLATHADLITPNLTEACLLQDMPYPEVPPAFAEARTYCKRLAALGPRYVVITSLSLQEGTLTNLGYDRETDTFVPVSGQRFPVKYHGTGDIFTSVLTGALLNNLSFAEALIKATAFVTGCVRTTYAANSPPLDGLCIEPMLHQLYGAVPPLESP